MSYGLVICSSCRREVHQDGPNHPTGPTGRQLAKTWTHCEDKSPRCDGAVSVYPKQAQEIVGPVCCRDELGGMERSER